MTLGFRDPAFPARTANERNRRRIAARGAVHPAMLQSMRSMIGLRWSVAVGLFLAATLFHLWTPYSFLPALTIALTMGVYNAAALLHLRRLARYGPLWENRELPYALNLQFALDLLMLTAAIHFTGGLGSFLLPLFLVLLPASGLILSRRAIYLQAAWSVFLLGVLFNPAQHRSELLLANAGSALAANWLFQVGLVCLGAYVGDQVRGRLHRAQQQGRRAREAARRDGLTGLYNRRYLFRVLERELARSTRYGREVSVLMLDVDDFKRYNDRYGHLAGDAVLRELARLMHALTRESDLAFRYGGEEFVLVLPETGMDAALRMAERLRRAVAEHRFVDRAGEALGRVTVSVGVATFPVDARAAEDLLHAADQALLRAKRRKNRVCGRGDACVAAVVHDH